MITHRFYTPEVMNMSAARYKLSKGAFTAIKRQIKV